MTIELLEHLAMAICKTNGGFSDPECSAYKLKNPGMLRLYLQESSRPANTDGFRIFTSFIGGYRALVSDLEKKCGGKTRLLTPESTVRDLLNCYDIKVPDKAVSFIRRATGDEVICQTTEIGFFIHGNH